MKAQLLIVPLLLMLSACAGMETREPAIPADAVENTRTEANGDVITEYRVAGQLRVVRVQPLRGPAYYLYDQGGRIGSDADDPPRTYFKLFEW